MIVSGGGGGGGGVRGNSSTEYRVLSHRHKGELAVFPPKGGKGAQHPLFTVFTQHRIVV